MLWSVHDRYYPSKLVNFRSASTPAYQKYSRDTGNVPLEPMTLGQAASFYKSEGEKYSKVARSINLTPQ